MAAQVHKAAESESMSFFIRKKDKGEIACQTYPG